MKETSVTPDSGDHGHDSPLATARRWADLVEAQDREGIRHLYEVRAAVHDMDGSVLLGTENIVDAMLARSVESEAQIESDSGGVVTLTWPDPSGHGDDTSVRLRVRRGKIVEQWNGEQRSGASKLGSIPMNMSVDGDVSPEDRDLVWDLVDKLVSRRDERVTFVDVRLRRREQRIESPVALRVIIDLPGGSVRANADTVDVRSATQVVERRLKESLRRRADRRSASSGDETVRVEPFAAPLDASTRRPPMEREIVRHKTVSPGPSTFEEATFDLVSMGYDFFLYVDITSGRDAVVAAVSDGSLAGTVDPAESSLAQARERLDAGREPFVFYTDQESGRGNVLYRRFDGHYGLIVPADA